MGSSNSSSLRSLPRVFVPGIDPSQAFDLPQAELDKLRKVLRLSTGDPIAVLPNDGSVVRCELKGRQAIPLDVTFPEVEPPCRLSLAQAFPKGDKLEAIVRACTEIGASEFIFFESDRSVVKWDASKREQRLARLGIIAREAAEVAFRTRLPQLSLMRNLDQVLEQHPDAKVLSEVEGVARTLGRTDDGQTVVVGPEGGWSRREVELIAERAVTMGPRVLRVDHAAAAACAILLLDHQAG